MVYLVLGLVVFLSLHSVRIVADGWRARTIQRIGAQPWKGLYSVLSLLGFALIIWGFGQARAQPVQLWSPPLAMRHVALSESGWMDNVPVEAPASAPDSIAQNANRAVN